MDTGLTLDQARPARAIPQSILIAFVLLFPLLAYFATARSIVAIWERSDTFAHGYVILPISLWLIWQRRAELARLPVQPWWPALPLLLGCGFAWLLADLGEIQSVRQYAFAAMLPLVALAILGVRMARAMAFPLAFILFAVPFGEIFIDPLIGVTADFTVKAVQMTGIPVYREGNNFTLPSGNWSVVEACSGVRYLISSVTLGALYAYLTYRSLRRRLIFVAFSILVPIIANGLRAYMIVMMGHFSGMTMAVGVDHLVYGWVFFGIVMFLLFWVGSYWREDRDDKDVDARIAAMPYPAPVPMARLAPAALAIVACLGIWPAYKLWIDAPDASRAPIDLGSFQPAWAPGSFNTSWRPEYPQGQGELQRSYQQGSQSVALMVRYYRNPPAGTKLISSTNRIAQSAGAGWREIANVAHSANGFGVRESVLHSLEGKLVVWQWYWIGGDTTASPVKGKIMQVRQKLLHGRDDSAAVMIAAPFSEQPAEARAALAAFVAANAGTLHASLAQIQRP